MQSTVRSSVGEGNTSSLRLLHLPIVRSEKLLYREVAMAFTYEFNTTCTCAFHAREYNYARIFARARRKRVRERV